MRFLNLRDVIKQKFEQGTSFHDIFLFVAKRYEPKFELVDTNIQFYEQLKYYFTNNSKFNGDLNKGLLIMSEFGLGKSLALQIYNTITSALIDSKSFLFYDTDEIIESFTKNGRPSIENYNSYNDIAIDDLGCDSGKHYYYGSIDDPVGVLLERRYKKFKESGRLTHATTNLDPEHLKERFSGMVYDRMREMFNRLTLVGESWRK